MHVFLSHNSRDKPKVEKLAERLDDAGYTPWLDKWNLIPGDPWQEELEKALKDASCILVFLGTELGPWHNEEMRAALERRVKGKARVIPVLLPGAEKPPDIPLFLSGLAWVSFRHESDDDAFHRLCRGIEGKPPGRGAGKTATEAKPSFRVLVAATTKDLGEARRETTAYLRNVLNMDAVEGSAEKPVDPADFDLAVLIQAWWWDNGVPAEAWKTVPPSKRLLFTVEEDANWPPRKLNEWPATEAIEAFLAEHSAYASFQEPADIPRIIGDAADRFRRDHTANAGRQGLSEAERAYLEMRLPAWLEGRSGESRGFSGPEEIYEEHFYVPLDATSTRWSRNEEQGLIRSEPKTMEERGEKASSRAPLAWWACRPELPRLVLSGSPGAGKTVFLTRLAAGLADHLLGGRNTYEPHLTPADLRVGDHLPVPVMLEATELGRRRLTGYGDLVAAVHHALCAPQLTQNPDPAETRQSLSAGRYLLLIDALDEIPDEASRKNLLAFLKGCCPQPGPLRMVLTTRSARYTGRLGFGPQFEVVELTDLSQEQMTALCERFRVMKGEPPEFLDKLTGALQGIAGRTGADETNLVGNPLLLATACSVFHKLRQLPNDRAELCELIVAHLCRSKVSRFDEEDPRGKDRQDWALPPELKRDLLERIALAMQMEKAQTWPAAKIYRVVAEGIGDHAQDRQRLAQYVKWLVEHTGLLYLQAGDDQGEVLRFHHRLFREYLAACRLGKGNRPIEDVLEDLWEQELLTDTNWLDVIRLLPGAMNNADKAIVMAHTMAALAEKHAAQRGRLLAVLAATIVESEGLFRFFDRAEFVRHAVARYEDEGARWDLPTRQLLLENVGYLGDPRLNARDRGYWISQSNATFIMGDKDVWSESSHHEHQVTISKPFLLARFAVTNAEYAEFMRDGGYETKTWWDPKGLDWLADLKKKEPAYWNESDWNRPNQPVVGVSWWEARAYCRRLTALLDRENPDWWAPGMMVDLPSEAQWELAARGSEGRIYAWGDEAPTPDNAAYAPNDLRGALPVGAYPRGKTPEGVRELCGNVWEWCRDCWDEKAYEHCEPRIDPVVDKPASGRVVRGGSWNLDADRLRAAVRDGDFAGDRCGDIGFRCAVVSAPVERGS